MYRRRERSGNRLLSAALLLGATLLVGVFSLPSLAHAGLGFRFPVAEHAAAGGIEVQAAPGSRVSAQFMLVNTGAERASAKIYGVAAQTGATTGVVYAQTPRTGAGAWLAPSIDSASLSGPEERVVNVQISVPSGASPGDHVAGVAIEQPPAGGAITQVVRAVVPVHVVVSGPARMQGTVSGAAVDALPGTSLPAVHATLVNSGARVCRPRLRVALVGHGEKGAAVTRQLDAVLPGDSVRYALPWPRLLARGTYEMAATMTGCGDAHTLDEPVVYGERTTRDDAGTPGAAPPGSPARPGDATYVPGPASGARTPVVMPPASGRGGGDPPPALDGAGTPLPQGALTGAGIGPEPAGKTGVARLLEQVSGNVDEILKRAGLPLLLLLLVALLFLLQEAFDRRDPKLALAPVHREPDLAFEPWDGSAPAAHSDAGSRPAPLVRMPTPLPPARHGPMT